jgi:teichuronopeptide biosynthesis TupA-like protein
MPDIMASLVKQVYQFCTPTSYRIANYELRQKLYQSFIDCLPDHYIQATEFKRVFGRRLNWNFPSTFNEKIHWIMRFNRQPIMTQLADKYAVREYVANRIGPNVLKELYGVWDDPSAIDFERLPPSFALKVTWGSGQNILCRDKSTLDVDKTRAQLGQWMKRGMYNLFREWAYKDIIPRIICEEFIQDENGHIPTDYKLFCFNGEPHFIEVVTNRFIDHRRHIFDLTWKHLPFNIGYASNCDALPQPPTLGTMISAARTLSVGFPFVRVDLYSVGSRVMFGEMTWYPDAGFVKFVPDSYDRRIGEALILPSQDAPAPVRTSRIVATGQ